MISLEQIVRLALADSRVMDQLGEALRSDLVVAHPFLRQLCEFADDFLGRFRKLPGPTDFSLWWDSLPDGQQEGCRETWGRLQAQPLPEVETDHLTATVFPILQQAAVRTVMSRLNSAQAPTVELFHQLREKMDAVHPRSLSGLVQLREIEKWLVPSRDDELIPTGFPKLDRTIGGWGKELWIVFADSGIGKSMLLQNFLVNCALRGSRCLHVSLELGLRPQIARFYRQIAQVTRAEVQTNTANVRSRLSHWFRLAKGELLLMEFPAYSVTVEDLRRVIERVSRTIGDVDVVALDYLDLIAPGGRSRGAYEDLGRITHEVRGFCPSFNTTVLTASQAVRRPEKAYRLTVKDMGDSYNKVRGADGLLSLVQSPEEEEIHQGRLTVLKVRDSGGRGQEIPLYINREMAVIQPLDHPNTYRLMERLGQELVRSPPQPSKKTEA